MIDAGIEKISSFHLPLRHLVRAFNMLPNTTKNKSAASNDPKWRVYF
jgi:hypothetical protein